MGAGSQGCSRGGSARGPALAVVGGLGNLRRQHPSTILIFCTLTLAFCGVSMSDAIKKGTEMHDALAHRYAAKKPAVGVWVEVISYSDDHWDPTTVVGAVGTIVQIHDRPARTKGAPDTYSVLLTLLNGQKWEDVVFADEVRFLWGGELEALAVLTKNQKLLKERS